jgi:carbamoylphosphate synthase large subunit
MLEMNILLTEASGYKAVCAAAFLRHYYPSLRIVTCDQSPLTRWIRTRYTDRHYVVPPVSRGEEPYLRAVEDICREEAIDLLLPTHSSEMPALLRERQRFGETLRYWGGFDTFSLLNDKEQLPTVAERLGLRIPRRYKSIERADLPFVVKPRISSGARGVRFVFSEKARAHLLREPLSHNGSIVQEYVQGVGAGVSAFCTDGEMLVHYAHLRLAEFPASGGSSVYRQTLQHEGLHATAAKLLAAVRWSGFCMVEFKIGPQGNACLMEVNPRIWGSLNQGLMNGANYFAPLLGPPVNARRQTVSEIRTYHSPLLYVAFLQYLRRLRVGPLVSFLRFLPSNRADISLLRDPLGWLGFLTRL